MSVVQSLFKHNKWFELYLQVHSFGSPLRFQLLHLSKIRKLKKNFVKRFFIFELNPLEFSSVGGLMGFMMDEGNTVEPTSYVTFFEYVPARELSRDDEMFE